MIYYVSIFCGNDNNELCNMNNNNNNNHNNIRKDWGGFAAWNAYFVFTDIERIGR